MRKKLSYAKNMICILILSVMVLSLPFFRINALAETKGETTSKEKVVRVGYVDMPTYEEGKDGEYKTGAGYEYLQKISYYTGWKYEYVYGSFQELYTMLEKGEIDLFGDMTYTKERSKLFHFSTYPQGKDSYFLYTRKDRNDLLEGNIERLNGSKIGVTKDSYQATLLRNWLKDNDIKAQIIEYDGYDSSMDALDQKKIDAIATTKLSSNGYDYATLMNIGFSDYYFAVSKKRADILSQLNEALYQIQSANPSYNEMLESKYRVEMITDTSITKKEKKWLNSHENKIRFGYLKNSLPYSDQDKTGKFVGVLNTLLQSIQKDFNTEMEARGYGTYEQLQAALEAGEVDAIGPVYSDNWIAEQNNVIQTNVLVTSTPVLFYKTNDSGRVDDVIAVSKNSFLHESVVKILFPDAKVVVYNTMEECLNAVKNGQVQSMIAAASQMNLMNQYTTTQHLQVAEMAKQIDVCMYTRKDDPELASIINKELAASGNILSKAVVSQNSYAVKKYTMKQFISENVVVLTTLAMLVITGLLFIALYMIRVVKELREANEKIVEKQEELKDALQEAERANRAKTTFLTNMSHDIRTPINGIMGMLEMIDRNYDDKEKTKECLGKIKTSSNHLLQLINDILDLSRLESGQVVLEHIPFNLKEVGEESLSIVETQAIEAGLKPVSEHMENPDIWLIGSPLHYKQVMINLYTNAIKYNKPGGVLYTNLEEVSRTDDILTLRITVRDTGIGMTQEFIEKELFTPFMQGENGARTKFKGSGIGMSIVKKIVEEMNGSISVESEVGEGTTFTVILPFEIDHSKHEKKEQREEIGNANGDISGTKVLLVEDNELNMEIAQFMLEDAGAIVVQAENGNEAIKTFTKCPEGTFDIILMDIMMPKLNGLEATKIIRNLDRTDARTIPIFAMTANAFSEDIQKSKEVGMNEHIIKPIDAEKMIALIAKYMKK